MVRERGLDAPPDAPANWPWAVAIRTLGGFELTLSGEPLRQEGKPQRKPLDLLKALAARDAEAYAGINATSLAEELWPDLDVVDNKASLHTTLHRARKLLGNERALLHTDGRVAFDPRLVWCDTVAFRECAKRISQLPSEPGAASGDGAGNKARALAREPVSYTHLTLPTIYSV